MDKWDMARRKNETDIAKTTIERAKKRLRLSSPVIVGNDYYLPGLEQFGDAYNEYHLQTDGKGTWYCSCYDHYYGESRQERVCSHAVTCALYANLPCQRTLSFSEKPKPPEEPKWRTPERPCDISGIPAKYTSWRPYQRGSVEWISKQLQTE